MADAQTTFQLEAESELSYRTEGIRYTGSKRALLPKLHGVIKSLKIESVLDGFSGSTRVAQFLKAAGYDVTANDLAHYSRVLAECYLANNETAPAGTIEKIRHLNSLRPVDGFFTQHYAGDDDGTGNVISSDGKKKPFLRKNARKLDAVRPEIDKIADGKIEHAILLTALINGLDQVENTLGHQVAYLSRWAPRARNDVTLALPRLLSGNGKYTVLQQDVSTISKYHDLAYFDPPYNTNNTHTPTTRVRYASYYHIWTTIVRNDRPEVVGASNRRFDCSSDSLPGNITPYESTKYEVVLQEINKLIDSANAKYVLFSYSNKGKIEIKDLVELFSRYNLLTTVSIVHKENIQRTLTINNEWLGDQKQNREYLFLIQKT